MEAMAALRQDANELAVGELGKAYGAVEQRDAPRSGGGGGVERERGERADSLLFEALVGRSGEGDGGRWGNRVMEAVAASDEGETDDAYEGAQEAGEDDNDVGVEGEGTRRLRRRRQEKPCRGAHFVVD